jgi:hypothetical protein
MSPLDPIDFVRCWFCHVGANEGGEVEMVLFDRMGKGIIFLASIVVVLASIFMH